MKVILPYNIMVLCKDDFFVEGLKPGSIVRGYHYNEKKNVEFPITKVTPLGEVISAEIEFAGIKPIVLCSLTKLLSLGGPTVSYNAPFGMGVCNVNPRTVNTYPIKNCNETGQVIAAYELEWDNDSYFLWAEGILVGSPN